jgi:hypothetical protein
MRHDHRAPRTAQSPRYGRPRRQRRYDVELEDSTYVRIWTGPGLADDPQLNALRAAATRGACPPPGGRA